MKKRPAETLIAPKHTTVLGSIKIERVPGDPRYVILIEDFWFYSTILKRWCCIPHSFVYDEESVPIIKGSNPESGAIHDYLCRTDSEPVVDKLTAAQVYLEFQGYYDALEISRARWPWLAKIKQAVNRSADVIRRRLKRDAVVVFMGYFHKHTVLATYAEIAELAPKGGGEPCLG